MLIKVYLILVLNDLVFCQNQNLIDALGDHGDRIADLEKLVKTLVSSQATLQNEVAELNATNADLTLQLQVISIFIFIRPPKYNNEFYICLYSHSKS